MKTPSRVIHCIAQCKDCEWSEDDYKSAARKAAVHSRREGHTVGVEQGIWYNVKPDVATSAPYRR